MKTILFQGDSITDAFRSRNTEDNYFTGHGYATIVMSRLMYEKPGAFSFFNRGVSGDKVVDVLARMNRDIINLKPDYMSLLIGVNDVWSDIRFGDGTSEELYEKVYELIIEESLKALPQLKIAALEPFVLRNRDNEEYYDVFRSEVEKRAAAAKRVADKFHLAFVPLQARFDEKAAESGDTSHWLRDGVHPTAAGHKLIADAWYDDFYKKEITAL